MSTIYRIAAVGIFILTIATGCSSLKIVYRQLDWYIPAYIDQYISLEDRQYRFVEARVDHLLQWHCEKALTEYAIWLETIRSDLLQNRLDLGRIKYLSQQTDNFWKDIIVNSTPSIVEFFTTVSDEQLQQLINKIKERNEELQNEFVKADRNRVRSQLAKRMEDRVERWIDELEPGQQQLIAEWSDNAAIGQKLWFENRLKWQERFFTIIKKHRANPDTLSKELEELFLNPEEYRSPEYRQHALHYRINILELLNKLILSITREQRNYMIRTLKNYATDIRELACVKNIES